ncbi:MAG: DUF2905 domain-containing protein [Blastocatellia bacterium]|nr:DUF2905 domain-containing protein [Blastocatellia bacterium]MCS7158468.1 DUF2905 domain-containing protein [Blastocatellia bacterium]MCX7753461.1 DUF2905 domain-containing protein [Blastocatellia bacterium]MDW8167851.1 DUF2905 domain-containing protein [Acidobacteriota bacterium]MDW8255886.1 DUF2905 domain-containing protein [Acidobacteriota bacterium]
MMPWEGLGGMGRLFIVIGLLFVVFGLVLVLLERFPQIPLGRLPGDIRIERENVRFYFPLVTSLILSLIATILWSLVSSLRK